MIEVDNNEKEYLEKYDSDKYWKPSVAADTLLFVTDDLNNDNELKVLLIKRGNYPYKNHWALPGGFLEQGETLRQTALRELKEETNLDKIRLKQLAVWDDPNRDPRSRIISLSFLGLAKGQNLTLKAGDDASDAKIFSIGISTDRNFLELSLSNEDNSLYAILKTDEDNYINNEIIRSDGIAFDHAKIIVYGIKYLLDKMESDKIILNDDKTLLKNNAFIELIKKIGGYTNEENE